MGVIGTALAVGLVVSAVAFAAAQMSAARAPRGRRILEARRPTRRPVPKRRAERPSLASRVVAPTTAAAGTGAAIVLVTAGAASAPAGGGAVRAGQPVDIAATAHETQAARPGPATEVDRVRTERARADKPDPQEPAAQPDAPQSPPTQSPQPVAAPSPRPEVAGPVDAPTSAAEAETEPGLVEGVLDGVGGLLDGGGGLLGP